MAKLTEALMFWEKIPDNPEARKKMMGWIYEVAEDSGYSAGSPHHKEPFYCIEVRIIADRLAGGEESGDQANLFWHGTCVCRW
jgi:hypothetical protein